MARCGERAPRWKTYSWPPRTFKGRPGEPLEGRSRSSWWACGGPSCSAFPGYLHCCAWCGFWFRRTSAIVDKEMRQLFRERLTLGMIVGLPLIQIVLFGYAINTDVRHMAAGLVDHADTSMSRQLVGSLEASQVLDFVSRSGDGCRNAGRNAPWRPAHRALHPGGFRAPPERRRPSAGATHGRCRRSDHHQRGRAAGAVSSVAAPPKPDSRTCPWLSASTSTPNGARPCRSCPHWSA